MDTTSKIVITPYKSMQGKMSLIFFSVISGLLLITGVLSYAFSPKQDISLLIFFLIFSFLMDSVGVILFIRYPRASLIFDGETNRVIIRDSRKPDKIIPFTELQTFFIFESVLRYTRYFFCLNDSFGEFSYLFGTISHEKTLQKSKSLIKLVHGTLMDTNGSHITWNEVN